jgi:hypothetical protein
MAKGIKIFFDSNVILGSAQLKLLEEPQLRYYVDSGLLNKPWTFTASDELLEKVFELRDKKVDIEPFISRKVKEEVNDVSSIANLEAKILKPLKLQQKIPKLADADKKVFELTLYQIFLIKLPLYVNEMLDNFSSVIVDRDECYNIRDELFKTIYQPLFPRYTRLVEKFVLSGMPEAKLKLDKDYPEYKGLYYNLRSFTTEESPTKIKDYKKITDLLILAEAIYSYKKMVKEMKDSPEFYFVSNDTICIPVTVNGAVFDNVSRNIHITYQINTADAKHMLGIINDLPV